MQRWATSAVLRCSKRSTPLFALHHVADQFTTSRFLTTTSSSSSSSGENVYQKALEMMERSKTIEEEQEKERSKKMYQAWQKSQQAEQKNDTSSNSRSQGVAVVKTLVKETRRSAIKKNDDGKDFMKQAMELLEQAAQEYGHPMALVQLGNLRLEEAGRQKGGTTSSKSKQLALEALDLYRRAGEKGSRVGWYNFGNLLWTGYPVQADDDDGGGGENDEEYIAVEKIINPDLHEAMEAFNHAIDLGDSDAMYLVGVHRTTSGGRENIHSGLNLIEKAADMGHGGAMYYLALLNLNGEPNIGLEPCTLDTFVSLLDRAVEGGSVDAVFTRGHSHYHGTEGYQQSYEKALEDFISGAKAGHADCAVSAGAMLHSGTGVPKDQRQAFDFYQLAGELGSQEGWQNVVACYLSGEGVTKSLETAQYIAETMLNETLDLERFKDD